MAQQRRWYDFCVAFKRLDLAGRQKAYPSKKTRAAFARIARMHPVEGRALDDAGAPLRCLIWVAYAPDEPGVPTNFAQKQRYEALQKYREVRKKWPHTRQLSFLRIQIWEKLHGRVAAPAPGTPAAQRAEETASETVGERSGEQATLNRILALTMTQSAGLDRQRLDELSARIAEIRQEFARAS